MGKSPDWVKGYVFLLLNQTKTHFLMSPRQPMGLRHFHRQDPSWGWSRAQNRSQLVRAALSRGLASPPSALEPQPGPQGDAVISRHRRAAYDSRGGGRTGEVSASKGAGTPAHTHQSQVLGLPRLPSQAGAERKHGCSCHTF